MSIEKMNEIYDLLQSMKEDKIEHLIALLGMDTHEPYKDFVYIEHYRDYEFSHYFDKKDLIKYLSVYCKVNKHKKLWYYIEKNHLTIKTDEIKKINLKYYKTFSYEC